MCRHLAYVGPAEPLGALLVGPPHGLYRQSWAPRRQRHGTVNADGFGVGWYAEGDPVPARYRRAGPIWADLSFTDLARVVRTQALLAAVRDATLSGADAEAAAPPSRRGRGCSATTGRCRAGRVRSRRWRPRCPPPTCCRWRRATTRRSCGRWCWRGCGPATRWGRRWPTRWPRSRRRRRAARLNLLLTDGVTVTATAWGDTLWYLARPGGGTVVASEPYDDDPHWQEVPDRTLLAASRADVLLTPLKEPLT